MTLYYTVVVGDITKVTTKGRGGEKERAISLINEVVLRRRGRVGSPTSTVLLLLCPSTTS